MKDRTYIAIDLKSFYASVECIQRCLDPLTTNLVVADESRTEKTICLAVSPSLKAYGIPGRARLFEALQKLKEVNDIRRLRAPGRKLTGKSFDDVEIQNDPSLEIDLIIAPPQMTKYMEISSYIYSIYLRYIAPEDIHVYSIDEVFIDITNYLKTYRMTARELTMKLIREVLNETGITATAGIGTNLFLCKVAMDIVAKHIKPDKYGVRIAELDEMSYRDLLWEHKPLTDFWRIGHGYSRKLEALGLYTMGDIALCSVGKDNDFYNEELLYKNFGINAELLIDHAWGWEPCTIEDIKKYKPSSNSLSSGQVLPCAYSFEKGKLIAKEMADGMALDLVAKKLVCDQVVLTVCYDNSCLSDPEIRKKYKGPVEKDWYGRSVPKSVHGSQNLNIQTSSSELIVKAVSTLYDKLVNPDLLVRRIFLVANRVIDENLVDKELKFEQLDMFTDYAKKEQEQATKKEKLAKEKKKQEAILAIKNKYGKNSIVKGMNLKEGATAIERNGQVGGHKA